MATYAKVLATAYTKYVSPQQEWREKEQMRVEEILANWPCIEEIEEYYEPAPPAYLGSKKSFGTSYDWKFEEVEWIREEEPDYAEYDFDQAMIDLVDADVPNKWELKQFYKLLHTESDEKIDELIELCKLSVDYVPKGRSRNLRLLTRMQVLLQLFRMTRMKCRTRLLYSSIDDWHYLQHITSRDVYMWRNYKYFDCIEHDSSDIVEAEPESGEEQAIGEEKVVTAQASNVVLSTAREPSVALIKQPTIKWSKFVAGDVSGKFEEVTNRWLTLGSFTWTTDQRTSQIIYQTVTKQGSRTPILPLDAVYYSGTAPCDMPNLIPFKVHELWRGNMEVKIQVNSNKFQIGQLLATFYYQPNLNDNIADKKNIFSASQMDSVIIQASASNEAILRINYNHMYPMLPTRLVPTVDTLEPVLNMGELWIMVQNQLATTTMGPKKCYGSVLVRFIDSEFAGMSYGGYAPQFEAGEIQAIVKTAENVLHNVNTLMNQDAPTNIQSGLYVVPTTAHNWSAGKNVAEQLHVLRLDPAGTTAHQNTSTETSIKEIVNKYGLIDILTWPTESQASGKKGAVLKTYPAAPDTLFNRIGDGSLANYITPPVGIISSLFHQWRGSVEFKIQFVASQFHTGRLLVAYIPGYVSGPIDLRTVKASPHVIFDLQEQREFSYIVPYNAYKPWWTRQQSGNYLPANSPAPSTVVLMVYNELVAMESIVPYVYINVYMRAGPDFEVAIPVQPSISLTWYKDFVYPSEDKIAAINGYYPYYYGFWKGINNSNTLVARWGSAVDQTAEFPDDGIKLQPKEYMYYTLDNNLPITSYPTVIKDNKSQTPKYAIIKQSGHGYAILIPFNNELNVKRASYDIYVNNKSLSDPTVTRYMLNSPSFGAGNYGTGNPAWVRRIQDEPVVIREDYEVVEQEDVIYAEMESNEDNTSQAITTGPMLASLMNGMAYYGESFTDLKDLARRYVMYSQIQLASLIKQDINKCAFTFHALPQGLKPLVGTPAAPNELFNRCREGPIALISSLFRYYRGSLRFRVCLPPELQAKVWVQHRPDRVYNPKEDNTVRLCHKIDTAQGVFNHGYAYYIQYTNINGVIEFEVPYYSNTAYNALQLPSSVMTPLDQWGISLGQVNVGLEWIGDINVHQGKWISIFYAISDDMNFSQWVGGSRFLKLDDNATAVPEAGEEEMIESDDDDEESPWEERIQTFASGCDFDVEYEMAAYEDEQLPASFEADDEDLIFDATLLTPQERLEERIQHEGLFDYMTNKVSSEAKTVIQENVQGIKDEIAHIADKVLTEVGDTTKQVDKQTIAAMVGNLLHVIVNPVISTVVTSIVNILISIGVLAVSALTSAIEVLKRFLTKIGPDDQANQPPCSPVVEAVPEADFSLNEEAASWCSLIYNGLTNMMSLTLKRPKTWQQWQDIMTKDLSNNSRGANQIYIFIRNTMDCIRKMLDYILCRSNKDYKMLKLVESSPECIKMWCEEVLYLTDPAIRRDSVGNANYADRVYDAQVFGQMLITDMSFELKTEKNTPLLSKLYDKITSLKDDLLEMGQHPHVRKLPFTIYMYGEPGIGKSHLCTALCCRLLKAYKYTTKKGLKCTLNPQSDYWDQCDHQPVLEIDDLWAVTTPGALEKQLLTLFQVVSPIVLSPPKAALEEKKMRYNPEIFYINSNKDFPVYNDVNKEAIWRRRDVLIKARLSSKTIPNCPHCFEGVPIEKVEPRWLEDFHHLDFWIAKNVKDDQTAYDGPYPYRELVEKLSQMFLANRARETILFNRRVMEHELLQVQENENEEWKTVTEKYQALQDQRYIQYKLLADRTLTEDLKKLKDIIYTNCQYRIKESWSTLTDFSNKVSVLLLGEKGKPYIFNNPPNPAKISALSKYVTTVYPESADDAFASTTEILNDDSDDAMLYKRPQPPVPVLNEFVNEGIYDKRDVAQINEFRDRLHDDGMIIQEFLQFNRVTIARVNQIKPDKIGTLEKTLDYINDFGNLHGESYYCIHTLGLHRGAALTGNKLFGSFRGQEHELTQECAGKCIMKSNYMKFLWYRRWLYTNPTHRLAYSRGKKEHLPEYFHNARITDLITPDSFLKSLYLQLKLAYQTRISPLIAKLTWWVKTLWPKITNALLMFGVVTAVASPIVAGGYCIRSINQSQKEVAHIQEECMKGNMTWTGDRWANCITGKEERFRWQDTHTPRLKDGKAWDTVSVLSNPFFASDKSANPQARIYDSGNVVSKSSTGNSVPIKVHPQASQQCEAVEKLIKQNTVMLKFYYQETMDVFRCIVLRGRQLLVIRHFIEMARAKKDNITRMTLVYDFQNEKRTNGCEIDIDFWSLRQTSYAGCIMDNVYESNVVVVEMPAHVPEFKSLTKFICPYKEWNSIGRKGRLIIGAKDTIRDLPIIWTETQPTSIQGKGPTNQVILGKCFRYPVHGSGMCGSILLSDNKEKPIIGIHVAGVGGVNGFGIAEPIYQEMIMGLPLQPERPVEYIAEPQLLDIDESDINLGNMIYKIGAVEKKDAQFQSTKTRIKPSLVHGVYEIRTEPNPLSKSDPRLPKSDFTPLENGCMKHGLPNLQIPDNLVRQAEEHLRNKILAKVVPLRSEVSKLSLQDAVCGMPDIPEYTALSFSTSAGFPLSSQKPRNEVGKKWLFKMNETEKGYQLEGLHPKLTQLMTVTNEMRRRNIKPMTVFSDCLKDTTLHKEKCTVLGKTRIFSISPVQYTIPFRQYIGDFMAAYRRARFDVNHAIGININGPEWSDLARRLQSKGTKVMTGDYSNYGPSLNPELVEAVIRIIQDWYKLHLPNDEEHHKMVAMLMQELLCAYHLCGDLIYRVPCGIPSGSPITDILNSMVGNLYLYCAWLAITNKPLSEYERYCYEVVYGDDVIQNISDEIIDIYNTETLSSFFQKYLIKFTDADKTGNIIKYHQLIDDATFLKHKFLPHPFRPYTVLAALDEVSIEGCANWISCAKVDDEEALTKTNCVMSCQLMFGHGPKKFNEHRSKLLKAMHMKNIYQPLPLWNDLDRMFFDTTTTSIRNYDIEGYYIMP